MTQLVSILDDLSAVLVEVRPSCLASLQPGLAIEEINNLMGDVEASMPLEFYELYQWRNGSEDEREYKGVFPGEFFHPLEHGVDLYFDLLEEAEEIGEICGRDPSTIWNRNWFPITSLEGHNLASGEFLCVVGDLQHRETSHLLKVVYSAAEVFAMYSSLRNLALVTLDCYRYGIYRVSDDDWIDLDDARFEEVYQRINPI
jgi:hypothetical protein